MADKELRVLRHRYRTAYTAYVACVHALSDANEKGARPLKEVLKLEASAINELNQSRDAFLAAIVNGTKTGESENSKWVSNIKGPSASMRARFAAASGFSGSVY